MSNFNTGYISPLDPDFVTEWAKVDARPAQQLEKPIIPVNELGITVVEKDPRSGANILQNVQAAIRAGASTIQLIMTTPANSAIGGRPKAYGKEVREAIREAAHANDLTIGGLEMPTSSHTNLSGFDNRRGFDEKKRYEDMQEIRDAIQFVADVAGGGGVDIWSQEFPRTIFDLEYNKGTKWENKFFEHPSEEKEAIKHLVDNRTGDIIKSVRMKDEVEAIKWKTNARGQFIDDNGNVIDAKDKIPEKDESGNFKVIKKHFEDFKADAHNENERIKREHHGKIPEGKKVYAEELQYKATLESQERQEIGQAQRYQVTFEKNRKRVKKALEWERIKDNPEEVRRFIDENGQEEVVKRISLLEQKDELEAEMRFAKEIASAHNLKVAEIKKIKDSVITAGRYAKEKTFESYADLGIYAMQETDHNPQVNKNKPLYVGPELGWPGSYGGHPEEFMELVKRSRKEMENKLVKEYNFDRKEAKRKAKTHIKGLFDTSHMGMWLRHFKREKGETEKQHQAKFNKWYGEMVDKLIKSDTVGSIQVVNSYSGAHGHLPPGQGIFPVVDAVKEFKKRGFKGFIVSEGHEEEQFEKNRIMMDTWRSFGAPLGRSYTGPQPTWGSINQGYFGKTYSPTFMVGAYSPSNDFKLWSEVPLE